MPESDAEVAIVGAALRGRPCVRAWYAYTGAATEGRPYNRSTRHQVSGELGKRNLFIISRKLKNAFIHLEREVRKLHRAA